MLSYLILYRDLFFLVKLLIKNALILLSMKFEYKVYFYMQIYWKWKIDNFSQTFSEFSNFFRYP